MAGKEFGSLTKEPPLNNLDQTILKIRPGMAYSTLLAFAKSETHDSAPGLIRKRFVRLESDNTFAYDRFLSLVSTHGIDSRLVRKVMFFVWAYRDERVRRFICERVADRAGKWRSNELINKDNALFFESEGWLQAGAAKKARSNIEFFLVETGLFDPKARKIHLELDDGWLYEAAAVAAQHEEDPRQRQLLVADPAQFLIRKGWQGLADASVKELLNIEKNPITDLIPLEDELITLQTREPSKGKGWNRKRPRQSDKKSTSAFIDLVARERANQSHFDLEELAARSIRSVGFEPRYNEHIDMYFITPDGCVLTEIKSCDSGNIHSQIRKGTSQLLEYRYVYSKILGVSPVLVLIVEAEPVGDKRWLIAYLESLGIILTWRDQAKATLVSACSECKLLNGIVTFLRS